MSTRRFGGFTLIELLVVLAIVAILATLAAPSFTDQFARRRIEGVATELNTDLQLARTQAVAAGGIWHLVTTSTTQYVVRNAAGTVTLKTANLPTGITLTNGVTVPFDPLRGTLTTGTADQQISLASTRTAAQMQLKVNAMGRVNICTPSGGLKGYTSC